ncbi:hypothetical protein RB653_008397 [Dictyostelium firmibasis]|uniref:Transmembrane protein n=1 Tax=Dictyostelium firmibasis TaxID=79012 RepID=A0AAN7TSI8_9MYCE
MQNNYIISNNKLDIEKKKKYSPTLLDKFIGLPPSNDPISSLKYKLKIYKIILICLGVFGLSIFFSITKFKERLTSFSIQYNNQTYLPQITFILDPPNVLDLFYFEFLRENIQTNSFDEIVVSGNLNPFTKNYTVTGIFSQCVNSEIDNYKGEFFGLMINDQCLYLYENQQLIIRIYLLAVNKKITWDCSISINDELSFLNSNVQMTTSLTKSIVTNKKGETKVNYKISKSISNSYKNLTLGNQQLDILEYGVFFSSNIVLDEKTQTNFLVIVGIFSKIGSLLIILFTGSDVFFSFLTKFLIRDKSAWVEDDVRECIIYHSNQINLKNLLNKENHDDKNSSYHGLEKKNVISVELDQGINDNQIQLEGDNDEDDHESKENPINPLVKNDQFERENAENNFKKLKNQPKREDENLEEEEEGNKLSIFKDETN